MKYTQYRDSSVSSKSRRWTKEKWIALFGLLMATALPALLVTIGGLSRPSERQPAWDDRQILFCRHEGNGEESLSLSRIVALSLAATNPSDTPMESLAAQAVALRSRAIWWMDYCTEGEIAAHSPHLCDSPSHGLPYLSREELNELYGEEEGTARLQAGEKAVKDTKGKVLCYGREVIPALLHHSGPGNTRSVRGLEWVSVVSSPEEGRVEKRKIGVEELRLSLASAFGMEIPEKPWEWSFEVDCDSDGWVKEVKIGEKWVSGDAFASALNLPSVCFTLQAERDGLSVTTVGEGSGCGLSREGASLYAEGGLTRWEILAHYYPNCTVENIAQ